ncbi:MAG: CRISPR-associated endonuclease Cas1, partial [Ignisphaera sp.]
MPILRHLIVDQYGAFLGKHHGRLQVTKDGEKLAEAPLLHLEEVLILGTGISLSADAVEACCTAGIPIYFLSPDGRPYAALYSAGLTGTVLTRREQLLAYRDRRGVELAVAFAKGKITNQAGFLRDLARYREEAAPEVGRRLNEAAERVRETLEDLRRLR